MSDIPRRAYRLVLDLEADTYAHLINALEDLGLGLEREPRYEGGEVTSGGYVSGYHVEITRNDGQTAAGYRRELTEWCNRRREERRARVAEVQS